MGRAGPAGLAPSNPGPAHQRRPMASPAKRDITPEQPLYLVASQYWPSTARFALRAAGSSGDTSERLRFQVIPPHGVLRCLFLQYLSLSLSPPRLARPSVI